MAIRKSGYVALFDVLGFSERVMRGALRDLDAYVNTVARNTRQQAGLGTILFSDTVVLYTFDDSEPSFDSIISSASKLLYDLLLAGVPVRGAISHGDFLRSADRRQGTVLAGRPIIEAHHYESRSQWVGVMFAPSVLEHRSQISKENCDLTPIATEQRRDQALAALVRLMFQPCARIPLEESPGQPSNWDGFAVVPLNHARTLRDIRDRLDSVLTALGRLKQLAPDARSQAKYQRSIDWLAEVRAEFGRAFKSRIIDARPLPKTDA